MGSGQWTAIDGNGRQWTAMDGNGRSNLQNKVSMKWHLTYWNGPGGLLLNLCLGSRAGGTW
jgi:hypothetical protein